MTGVAARIAGHRTQTIKLGYITLIVHQCPGAV
jgi:hypothetical protein